MIMSRFLVNAAVMMLCFSVSFAYGQGRSKETKKPGSEKPAVESKPEVKPEAKPEGKPANPAKPIPDQPAREPASKPHPKEGAKAPENGPGGAWSERTHSGKQPAAKEVEAPVKNRNPQAPGAHVGAPGARVEKRTTSKTPGAESAAGGKTAAKAHVAAGSGVSGNYDAVRKSFNQPNLYGQQWFANHPRAWFPSAWSAGTVWTVPAGNSVAVFLGFGSVTPFYFNYGDNVTYSDGVVLVDNENVGTADEFGQQAADLAQTGIDADVSGSQKWLSLGVFALVRNERQHPQLILQIAINPDGILRGNYTDEVSGQTSPIMGAVDRETQRAAWTVGENTQSVMEAGLNNLTENEAPVLIHRNGRTDHWILVRLNNGE
jgi:hypothetical protein